MIEETFFLYPPDWLKNPPNPAATRLFKTYAANAPYGTWPAKTSTHQGLYCMTADGGYLSGRFASQSNEMARTALNQGLAEWRKQVAAGSLKPKPVPTDPLDLYGGEPIQKGGLKLEVVYRDLPRGEIERPGNARFPNPYNLGWYDFSPGEARAFLVDGAEKQQLPDALFRKFAVKTLKDAVRGQMGDWKENEINSGELFSQLVGEEGTVKTFALSGSAEFKAGDQIFEPVLHGSLSFDSATGEFTDFRLIAAGQRAGRSGANGRETDLGPAPMGVGFKIYRAN
ncbi:MAG: hypothetical protein ACI8UO_006272 [Verrucomicrobiales bacterium]